MPENTPGFTPSAVAIPPYTLVGGPENIKLLFDEELDDRRLKRTFDQGWETLRLQNAQNLSAYAHAINMGSVLAGQAGVNDAEFNRTPIPTGAAASQNQQPAGSVYPPIRNVDQSAATANGVIQTALSGIAAAIAEQSNVTAKLADAVNALLAKSAGQSAGTVTPTVPAA